jgi:hypothetical protein
MVKQEEIQEEDTKEEDINNSKHTVVHSKQTHMLVTTRSVNSTLYIYVYVRKTDEQQGQAAQDPAQAGAGAATGAAPAQGSEAWAQYAAYWAAYGYDVNDPQCELCLCVRSER